MTSRPEMNELVNEDALAQEPGRLKVPGDTGLGAVVAPGGPETAFLKRSG